MQRSRGRPGTVPLGRNPSDLLGRSIEEVIDTANLERIVETAERGPIDEKNPIQMSVVTLRAERFVGAILHCSGGQIIVEIEPIQTVAQSSVNAFDQSSVVRSRASIPR